jgi:hypothetical protein
VTLNAGAGVSRGCEAGAAAVVCFLAVPGVFLEEAIAGAALAVEVEKGLVGHLELRCKARMAERAGCARNILMTDIQRIGLKPGSLIQL